ncbi:MAG TPA: pyridoxamine 5'-phosphate oxidase family protein [Chloroflexota bacterium]|nr:pyridoxamine 5'-phosphate oxidase family protein [Chloroflexota bacterium]
MFKHVISSEAELRELMGAASEGSIKKETTYLTDDCRRFIASSPFMLIATSGKDGRCDVAPKGDPSGSFVHVLDEKRLVIPDRPGNKRFDGLRNLFENPQIGLIFLVPGRTETLRVNGRAWITNDPEILDTMPMQGKRPWFAIGVEVEECFLHCGKALIRSKLWEPAAWPDLATVPSGAEIYKSSRNDVSETVEEIERGLVESYRTRLY